MIKIFKLRRDKFRVCGRKYIIDPKYRLFYISLDGKAILTCKVPENVLEIEIHRLGGSDICLGNVIGLETGDILRVTILNYEVHPRMSVLEKACAISKKYILYKGDGIYKELNVKPSSIVAKASYISIFNLRG